MENTRRIYCNIKDYELIFSKATHLINCTCEAEAWNTSCKHKLEFYKWLEFNNKITHQRVLDWLNREVWAV